MIVKSALAAAARDPAVAARVHVPALVTRQPEKEAIPAAAGRGLAVQPVTDAPPPVTARVTVLVSAVAALPYASCTATLGWVAKALPAVVGVDGWRVNAIRAAGPWPIVMADEVPVCDVALSVTVMLVVSASTSVTAIAATPAANDTLLPDPQPPAAG